MQGADGFSPSRARVPDVVGFVVEHHHPTVGGDFIPQCGSRIEGFGFGYYWTHPGVGILFSIPFAFGGIVEAMNVGEIERPTRSGSAGFVLQHHRQVPVAAPFGGNQRVFVKHTPVAKVVFEAFVDGEVGSNDDKMPRHL